MSDFKNSLGDQRIIDLGGGGGESLLVKMEGSPQFGVWGQLSSFVKMLHHITFIVQEWGEL